MVCLEITLSFLWPSKSLSSLRVDSTIAKKRNKLVNINLKCTFKNESLYTSGFIFAFKIKQVIYKFVIILTYCNFY